MRRYWLVGAGILLTMILQAAPMASASTRKDSGDPIKVIAVETFLADIAQNIAGNRIHISSLLPLGADPHTFQPTPADMKGIAESNVLIINGGGFEEYLDDLLKNLGGVRRVIDASAGLSFRAPGKEESTDSDERDHHDETASKGGDEHSHKGGHHHETAHHDGGDPHFWLSADNVIRYVENIRNGLSEADPAGAAVYAANAERYSAKLRDLDLWISDHVKQIPENRRLLVTDHDDLGYYADRYGLRIVGMVIPSISTEASPSARQVAGLVRKIRQTGAAAIFVETGEATQLAEQIAREAGIKVVTGLYTHSTSEPRGPCPNYIEMMRHNTGTIVNALK